MTSSEQQAQYCRDLAAGFADYGLSTVFISLGSRNTPMTLALAAEQRIKIVSIRDERSASFAALGFAKASGQPAAALCTSGSAAAHYLPAMIEANHAHVPLVVLTADRPKRLRGTGAPQTIDQQNLYGSHALSFYDLNLDSRDGRPDGQMIAERALSSPNGGVHVNLPLDDPLIPTLLPHRANGEEPMEFLDDYPAGLLVDDPLGSLNGRNVLIVASGKQHDEFGDAVVKVSSALNAPILSDAQCWITGPNTISHHDALASVDGLLEHHRPDIVLRLGPLPTSKALWSWLERSGVDQILINNSLLTDPLDSASSVHTVDPTVMLEKNVPDAGTDRSYLDTWLSLSHVCSDTIGSEIARLPFPNEPAIARSLIKAVGTGSIVYVASSMPIRDVDSFASARSDMTVLSNRGVNGIDGLISSALGAALTGSPVTLLIGDIAALHDASVLAEVQQLGAPLRIVVINNDGGGIFSFQPQATSDVISTDTFETHWGTPHGLSLARIAAAVGMSTRVVDRLDDYRHAVSARVDGPELIELFTDRANNVRHHNDISAAVAAAVSASSA